MRLIAMIFVGTAIACGANASAQEPADADLSEVFAARLPVVEQLKATKDAPGREFNAEALHKGVTYTAAPRRVGDFALYWYQKKNGGAFSPGYVAKSYLFLEYVARPPVDKRGQTRLRVSGSDLNEAGQVVRRKFEQLDEDYEQIDVLNRGWFPLLGAVDSPLEVNDLFLPPHYRDIYFKHEDVRFNEAWRRETGNDQRFGKLHEIELDFSVPGGVYAGTEVIVLGESVPVRGVVAIQSQWFSSSGASGSHDLLQLIHFGRLTDAQLQRLNADDDLLPDERRLQEELRRRVPPRRKIETTILGGELKLLDELKTEPSK